MTKVHPCCSSNNFSTQNVCPQRVRSIIAHARERVNSPCREYMSYYIGAWEYHTDFERFKKRKYQYEIIFEISAFFHLIIKH